MLGAGVSVGALARRGPPVSAVIAPVDADLTGSVPAWLTVARSTAGTRCAASGLIVAEPANTARVDFDPVSHAGRGVLLERQSTYYGPASEDAGGTGWTNVSGITVSPVTLNSPLRVSDTVSRIGGGPQSYSGTQAVGVPSGTGLTQCWLLRNFNSATSGILYRDNVASAQVQAKLTWAAETAGAALVSVVAGAATGGITCTACGFVDCGGGWYIAWAAFTFPATTSAHYARINPAQGPVGRYVDVAAVWVTDADATSPPSYLATAGSAVARTADVLAIDWAQLAALPLTLVWTPLAGGAAQSTVVQPGQQPSGLYGRVTRAYQ